MASDSIMARPMNSVRVMVFSASGWRDRASSALENGATHGDGGQHCAERDDQTGDDGRQHAEQVEVVHGFSLSFGFATAGAGGTATEFPASSGLSGSMAPAI